MKPQLVLDKDNYYKTKLHDEEQSISGAWKTVYSALGKTADSGPVQLVVGGETLLSPRGMANAFNNIFINSVASFGAVTFKIPW